MENKEKWMEKLRLETEKEKKRQRSDVDRMRDEIGNISRKE